MRFRRVGQADARKMPGVRIELPDREMAQGRAGGANARTASASTSGSYRRWKRRRRAVGLTGGKTSKTLGPSNLSSRVSHTMPYDPSLLPSQEQQAGSQHQFALGNPFQPVQLK